MTEIAGYFQSGASRGSRAAFELPIARACGKGSRGGSAQIQILFSLVSESVDIKFGKLFRLNKNLCK